jgi:hypothetical protein
MNKYQTREHDTKIDVRFPEGVYSAIELIATVDDAKIHHISNRRILTPTVIKIVKLGISQLMAQYPDKYPINLSDTGLSETSSIDLSANTLDRLSIVEGEIDLLKKLIDNLSDKLGDNQSDILDDSSRIDNQSDTLDDSSRIDNQSDILDDSSRIDNQSDTLDDSSRTDNQSDTLDDSSRIDSAIVNSNYDDRLAELVTSGMSTSDIAQMLTDESFTNTRGGDVTRQSIENKFKSNPELKTKYDDARSSKATN